MGEGDTVLNALVGALVTVVLAAVPFSPVIGGLIAGYLEGPDQSAGARVGGYSGAIATVPMLFVFLLIGGVLLAFLPVAVPDPNVAVLSVAGLVLVFVVFFFMLVYSAILGALGGYLGATLKDEDVV